MAVAGDLRCRITRLVDDDFLRRNHDPHGVSEELSLEISLLVHELHQIQGSKVASGVVQEHIFRTGVAGLDRTGIRARVPLVDAG